MHPDYLALADQYASFLIALGGISVTVLALILTLRKPPHSKSYAASVIALVVATLACFVGAHLMSQTAALRDPSADKETIVNASQAAGVEQPADQQPPLGVRHFIYASIDVYIALMLNSFAMMLLPTAYLGRGDENRRRRKRDRDAGQATAGNPAGENLIAKGVAAHDAHEQNVAEAGGVSVQDAAGISKITTWVFYFVLVSSYFWSLYFYIARLNTRQSLLWKIEVISYVTLTVAGMSVLYLVLLRRALRKKRFPQFTFYILIIIIAVSCIGFMSLDSVRGPLTIADAWLFCFAVSGSGTLLAGHSFRLNGRKFVKYRRRPRPRKEAVAQSPAAVTENETQKKSPPAQSK